MSTLLDLSSRRCRTLLGIAFVFLLMSASAVLKRVAALPFDPNQTMNRGQETELVSGVLDALHLAASKADGEAYFALFDQDAVYYGTDSSERWSLEEFRGYAKPHFDAGRGWTYESVERAIFLSPAGDCAWFDERLSNAKYGETRGTGVLVRSEAPGSPWRISQYNLSFPVPNVLAADLVARIRALEEPGQPESEPK